jgi:two-component system cell cycle sensor histidine kinase/response regulator CckA
VNQPESTTERPPVPVMVDAVDPRAHRLRSERTELIGWLAGAVAHDVNNMLAVIAGYADLIEADLAPGDPHATDTAGIRDAVARAGDLVRQLITVGRRQTLRLEVLDASRVVTGLLPLLSSACGDRIVVAVHPAAEPAAILADRSLLEQALLNLAVNARDAMPGGGTLTVRVSMGPRRAGLPGVPRDATGDTAEEVRIAVEDTGAGIDAAVLPHIFEPFFTTKGGGRGHGIGLASVEEAAEQCGGAVTVESRPGEGARFTLHLPRVSAGPASTGRSQPPQRARGGTETILVVDPDPEVRLLLARLLARHGYTVVDAATPRHAMALVEHALDRVDALITEASLPDISGTDLAELVRAVHPGVPVLLLSRAARSRALRPASRLAAEGVLDKPFSADELGESLRGLLDARPPDATA